VYGRTEQTIYGNTYFYYVGNTYETGTNRLTGTWLNREVAPTTYDLSLTYTYDQAGNPTSITDAPTTGAGDAQCFTYDGQRRLTQAWTPANANCATAPSTAGLGGAAPYWFTDTFDPVGNRTERVEHGVAGDTTHTYTYPAAGTAGAHTLTAVTAVGPDGTVTNTYGYDDAGNTTTRTVGEDPDQTLTWDPEGELATLAETGGASDSYLYTADGDRLVRHQDDATTVYLPGGQELTLAAGQVKATRYYAFNGTTVAVRTARGNAGVTTLISDHHGTAQLAIHNTTNAVTRKYTDPYGNPRGTTPTTWAGDHGYLDKPEDTTGLTQVGARYYDPVIGRFISVDPVMDLTDPQQWHGYAYANNNPITWSDPTGLRPQQHDGGGAGKYRVGTVPAHTRGDAPPESAGPPKCSEGIPVAVGVAFTTAGFFATEASGHGVTGGAAYLSDHKLTEAISIESSGPSRWNAHLLDNKGWTWAGRSIAGLDVGMIGWDAYDNYVNRYGDVEDGALRTQLAAERTITTATAGAVVTGVAFALLLASCPATAGGGCVAAAGLAAGILGAGAEIGSAYVYDEYRGEYLLNGEPATILAPGLEDPMSRGPGFVL
jgi:RHS repeat-associated protein